LGIDIEGKKDIPEIWISDHRMLRKYTKTKTNFSGDDSLKKSIYLSVKEIRKKRTNMLSVPVQKLYNRSSRTLALPCLIV